MRRSQPASPGGREGAGGRGGVGGTKDKVEKSIPLGVTISITIRLQPAITEAPRTKDAGKEVQFLSAIAGYLIFSVVLESILFGEQKCLLQSAMAFLKKHRVVWPGRQDPQAHLPKDGLPSDRWLPSSAGEGRCHPAPCLKHTLQPAGPKGPEALGPSRTGTGQVLPAAEGPAGPSALAHGWLRLAHIRMHRAGNQVTSPWKVVSFFFFF